MAPNPFNPGFRDTPNGSNDTSRLERAQELQLDRALFGLSASEEAELQLLLADLGRPMDESYEVTAAAFDVAVAPAIREPLPVTLRNRILAAGEAWASARRDGVDEAHDRQELTLAGLDDGESDERSSQRSSVIGRIGQTAHIWGGWAAAAACLAMAVMAWNREATRPTVIADSGSRSADNTASVMPDPVTLFTRLTSDPNAKIVSMANLDAKAGPPNPKPAAQIAWSNELQQGVLVVTNLPPIDRPGDQYQLWIHDALRDERFPVAGGVFDVPADRQGQPIMLAIAPPLRVGYAAQFSITVERHGGVVVSEQTDVVAAGDPLPTSSPQPSGSMSAN